MALQAQCNLRGGGTFLGHDDTIVAWQATEIPRYGCLGNRHGMTVGCGSLGNRHGMTVGCVADFRLPTSRFLRCDDV
jgi:hypothetical protein